MERLALALGLSPSRKTHQRSRLPPMPRLLSRVEYRTPHEVARERPRSKLAHGPGGRSRKFGWARLAARLPAMDAKLHFSHPVLTSLVNRRARCPVVVNPVLR